MEKQEGKAGRPFRERNTTPVLLSYQGIQQDAPGKKDPGCQRRQIR